MKKAFAALGLFLALLAPTQAAELRPFGAGAMSRLEAERQGRPFILALWSVDCPHCKDNLRRLVALAQSHPQLDLVVISTDSLGERKTIATRLAATGLAQRDTWVFGDAAPERLRFEIDPRWGGELPRTYLVDADHGRHGISGALDDTELQRWLAHNGLAGDARRRARP